MPIITYYTIKHKILQAYRNETPQEIASHLRKEDCNFFAAFGHESVAWAFETNGGDRYLEAQGRFYVKTVEDGDHKIARLLSIPEKEDISLPIPQFWKEPAMSTPEEETTN